MTEPRSAKLDAGFVREEVAAFHQRYAFGRSEEDAFPTWYLYHRYGVSPSDAAGQTSDSGEGGRRNNDYGLDAFHVLETPGERPTLILIQAKYTDSLSAVASGLHDLERSLPRVAEGLNGKPSEAHLENRVLVMLRKRLADLDPAVRADVKLRFEVLHLSDADELVVRANTRRAWDDLLQAIGDDPLLEAWSTPEVAVVGPSMMGGIAPPPPPPPGWLPLNLEAAELSLALQGRSASMYSGIGRLSQLVELYNMRRGDLFARNVRYFLTSKQNEERGPAGKIKETLRHMCIPTRQQYGAEPELFAFLHNGVTIFARGVRRDEDGKILEIQDPFVLNGCQTIRSAFDFRYGTKTAAKINSDRWESVAIPIRIITTPNEPLIRDITVSTNRQNAMSSSALRANDEVQLDLERRFKQRGIFYERQKGALDELTQANAAKLSQFNKSNNRAVTIEALARCLAGAAGEFDLAHSPSHIFESDQVYARVFSEPRLHSITFLIALQNLHDVLPAILKNDLGLQQSNPKGPRTNRLLYYALCLLLRYLAKTRNQDWLAMYGQELLGRQNSFRKDVVKQLDNYHSGIKRLLNDYFLPMEDTSAESFRDAFRRASWNSGLRDTIDVFSAFNDLDTSVDGDQQT